MKVWRGQKTVCRNPGQNIVLSRRIKKRPGRWLFIREGQGLLGFSGVREGPARSTVMVENTVLEEGLRYSLTLCMMQD